MIESGNTQPATSGAVAEAVNTINGDISTINNDLIFCMKPRIAGERMTNSQFQNRIYNNGYATACCGSVNLSDGPDGDMWISFIYIPHRTGIGGDNALYGTIIATAMTTNNSKIFIKHLIAGVWYGWQTK